MTRTLTTLLVLAQVGGCTPADTCRAHSDCGQGRCVDGDCVPAVPGRSPADVAGPAVGAAPDVSPPETSAPADAPAPDAAPPDAGPEVVAPPASGLQLISVPKKHGLASGIALWGDGLTIALVTHDQPEANPTDRDLGLQRRTLEGDVRGQPAAVFTPLPKEQSVAGVVATSAGFALSGTDRGSSSPAASVFWLDHELGYQETSTLWDPTSQSLGPPLRRARGEELYVPLAGKPEGDHKAKDNAILARLDPATRTLVWSLPLTDGAGFEGAYGVAAPELGSEVLVVGADQGPAAWRVNVDTQQIVASLGFGQPELSGSYFTAAEWAAPSETHPGGAYWVATSRNADHLSAHVLKVDPLGAPLAGPVALAGDAVPFSTLALVANASGVWALGRASSSQGTSFALPTLARLDADGALEWVVVVPGHLGAGVVTAGVLLPDGGLGLVGYTNLAVPDPVRAAWFLRLTAEQAL